MKTTDITAALNAYREATKNNVVDTEELDRRARICRSCKFRNRTRGVSRVSAFLGALSGKHGVPDDVKDYSCGVCQCSLLLLLPALPENLHEDSPKEKKRRPKHCWMLDIPSAI